MPNRQQQGTGKHPHKSSEQPHPHHEAGQHGEQGGGRQHAGKQDQHSRSGDSSDLKQREYKDAQGNVHHHTRTAGKSDKE